MLQDNEYYMLQNDEYNILQNDDHNIYYKIMNIIYLLQDDDYDDADYEYTSPGNSSEASRFFTICIPVLILLLMVV